MKKVIMMVFVGGLMLSNMLYAMTQKEVDAMLPVESTSIPKGMREPIQQWFKDKCGKKNLNSFFLKIVEDSERHGLCGNERMVIIQTVGHISHMGSGYAFAIDMDTNTIVNVYKETPSWKLCKDPAYEVITKAELCRRPL